jgi:hypothetical protein
MGDEMNAAAIVRLADEDGIEAVATEFGCTRRQAEDVVTRARARVRDGDTVGGVKVPSRIGRAFTDAETANLPGAYVDPSERTYAGQADKLKKYILEKNVANGYREWEYELGRMNNAS